MQYSRCDLTNAKYTGTIAALVLLVDFRKNEWREVSPEEQLENFLTCSSTVHGNTGKGEKGTAAVY